MQTNIREPTWRGHWKRLFKVTRVCWKSIKAPSGLHWCIGGMYGVLWVSNRDLLSVCVNALQMNSPNNLSKWALQCLFTFWNITILDCNSNYLVLYSILFFDTNVYNEYWLTSYYQFNGWNQGMAVVVQP